MSPSPPAPTVAVNLVLPPDSTPPVITGVGTSNLTDTSVIIKWLTDENANSAVDYGLTASYGSTVSNADDDAPVTRVSLTNLTPNTTYHYRVRSRNATGLQTNSADFTFPSNPAGVVNDVIVEADLSDGRLNSNPPYSDNSSFADSTLKSAALRPDGHGLALRDFRHAGLHREADAPRGRRDLRCLRHAGQRGQHLR